MKNLSVELQPLYSAISSMRNEDHTDESASDLLSLASLRQLDSSSHQGEAGWTSADLSDSNSITANRGSLFLTSHHSASGAGTSGLFGSCCRPPRTGTPPKQPTRTLFVGNLAVEVTESMLNELFSQFGVVVECCKRWYHYAFIQYSTETEALQALQTLDGHRIQGRAMRVEFQRKKLKGMTRSSEEDRMLPSRQMGSITQSLSSNSSSSTRGCVDFGATLFQGSAVISTQRNYNRKAIYVSVNQTDSYFTLPGEQVMPCIDYKVYELFPSSTKENLTRSSCVKSSDDSFSSRATNSRLPFTHSQSMNEMFPALEDSMQKDDGSKSTRAWKGAASDPSGTSRDSQAGQIATNGKRRYAHALRLLQG